MLVCMDSLESTMLFTSVADKVAPLRNDFNVVLERCNALSNETDLRFEDARRLAPLKQMNNTNSAYAVGVKVCRQPVKKSDFLSRYDMDFSRDLLTTDSEKQIRFG